MTPSSTDTPQTVSAAFTIEADGFRLQTRVTIPAGPTTVGDMLPLARALADTVVRETCKAVEGVGETISCQAGCGACCNNLVAISEVEARHIRDVVEQFPEPRRSTVLARFADALQRLERAGLLERLRASERWTGEEYATLVGTYFAQGIPCPFLEEGSCSIYEERPITCREYLVTSPAEFCARVGSEGVRRVRIPLPVFSAVARWQVPPPEHLMERVVPLITALEWAATHPDTSPPKPGPELLRELLEHLKG